MPGLDLVPFADQHLDDAARLLAARHARHCAAEPLLPAAFQDPAVARGAVEEAWRADGASGVVAEREGTVVGYLVGAPRNASWGPNIWVETAGHAVEEAETLRDLYGAAAARWVDAGATRHYALVPAAERPVRGADQGKGSGETGRFPQLSLTSPLVDAWFRLSFGLQHTLGIRETPLPAPTEGRVAVREARLDDVEGLVPLDLLGAHQAGSPTFASVPTTGPAELEEELAEEIGDPRAGLLVAELDGRIVGCASAAPVEYSSLHGGLARAEQACILGYAATVPEVRGSGAGLALTEGVYSWARERGYSTVVVDWRETNLLASRFWRGRGFRPTFLRLYRSIP
jgi:GNAT superfamily N-acetyltransferase